MQTFSSMQRNSRDIYIVKSIVFFISILFYQLLSSIYATIPPLIGLFFVYAVVLNYEKERSYQDYTHEWYQVILYLFIAEQMHGFELFSAAIAFGLFYYIFFEFSLDRIRFKTLFLIYLTIMGYLSVFLVSNTLSYFKDAEYLNFGVEYLAYMVAESLLVLFFFKGRIL